MGIGVGFDPLYATTSRSLPSSSSCSSASSFSRQCRGSKRISSAVPLKQNFPLHLTQSRSSWVSSPSFLQFSISGFHSPSEIRAQNELSGSGVLAGKLGSVNKCGHVQQNLVFGRERYFTDCPRVSGQRGRVASNGTRTGTEVSIGFYAENSYDTHVSCVSRLHDRRKVSKRGRLTVANCEAEGSGVSYDDRVAIVESGSAGSSAGVDKYARGNTESGMPDGGSDTSGVPNGKSGEVDSQGLTDTPLISEILTKVRDETGNESPLEAMSVILRVAKEDLEKCRLNSESYEEKAQRIAEKAISLKDEVSKNENLKNAAAARLVKILQDETNLEEEMEKAISAKAEAADLLNTAEAELENALLEAISDEEVTEKADSTTLKKDSLEVTTERTVDASVNSLNEDSSADKDTVEVKTEATAELAAGVASAIAEKRENVHNATSVLRDIEVNLERIYPELVRIRGERAQCELQVERLTLVANLSREIALAADEDAALAMAEAEKAVAVELEAAQRLGDAEFAINKAERDVVEAAKQASNFVALEAERLALSIGKSVEEDLEQISGEVETVEDIENGLPKEFHVEEVDAIAVRDAALAKEREEEIKHAEAAADQESKKAEPVKEPPVPKASKKRSSRFFAASYFSSDDGEEFSPGKAYSHFAATMKPKLAKVIVGVALLLVGGVYMSNRAENRALLPHLPAYSTSIEQANASTKPIIAEFKKLTYRVRNAVNKLAGQEVSEEEASLFDVLWLLLASVVFVPLFMKIPGGSPVLGYLVAGVLIGPHTMHIIKNVHGTKAIAEFGVVFLLFNIGLELSVERLSSMKKYVFGLGTAQVFATAAGVGVLLNYVSKITGPPAIIIASGLALSSTAVVLQVLQERGESTSRHGRATFSVLLFQDLAVVVLLILIPLLSAKGGVGLKEIGAALGVAGIKAVVAIVAIIASGRLFLRPIYKQMADNHNAEIFAANTLLVVLGTSLLTARAGLSMALGAFLAGLLLAETEFALQVESDIAPYRGLLLGLFFMTVGMSIDPKLLVAKFPEIATALAMLIVGKTILVAAIGRLFGLSSVAAVRTGLLLAPGGEFAFVAFGEAVNQGILSSQLSSLLFLVVGLSMALTPWLAAGGQLIAARFDQQDVRSLLPQENETDDLQGHIIICGFGRVGQIIAQLLSERLIPFVALDVRSERVTIGRQLDLPVYFGDAGSKEVLHKIGAERAAAAVITLDTPGANYRTVWALSKHYPNIKTFVRAHDVDHGITLEKAGATAVVPETLEPSLQLAAAVLAQAKVPAYEIASAIDEFRSRHLSELTELTQTSGTSLGYGFSRMMSKPLLEAAKIKADDEGGLDKVLEGTIVAVP